MPFQPSAGDFLAIDGVSYLVAEHPAAPVLPYGQEGRQSVVYQLVSGDGHRAALKVFRSRFRVPALASQAGGLARLATLPGLSACQRVILDPSRHADVLRAQPDLTYAALMAWIAGPTWMEVVLARQPLSIARSLELARSLAFTLSQLEERGITHGDLSGANAIVTASAGAGHGRVAPLELVDLEHLHGPLLERSPMLLSGTPGYAHPAAGDSARTTLVDRFPGAILLAEILGWCDPAVCIAAWGERYFETGELQRTSARYRRLAETIRRCWGQGPADLLERCWNSATPVECPPLAEWLARLPEQPPTVMPPGPDAEMPPEILARASIALGRRMEQEGDLAAAAALYGKALDLLPPGSEERFEAQARRDALAGVERFQVQGGRSGALALAPPSQPTHWPIIVDAPAPRSRRRKRLRAALLAAAAVVLLASAAAGAFWLLREDDSAEAEGNAATPIASLPGLLAVPITPLNAWSLTVASQVELPAISIGTAAISPDGTRLAAAGDEPAIRLWDTSNAAEVRLLEGHEGPIRALEFSPDGALLASAGTDETIRLWEVATGRLIHVLSGHNATVRAVTFSPGNVRLASGGDDGAVRLWDINTGREIRAMLGHEKSVRSVAFAPSGALLASGSADANVRLWNATTGAEVLILRGHLDNVRTVAFSPDGRQLASAGDDRVVRLWDVTAGAELRQMTGHRYAIRTVAFSRDGASLASGADDTDVRLWDVASGGELYRFTEHRDEIRATAFTADGARLLSAAADGLVVIWGPTAP